jgi:hypothetical protein
MQGWEMVRGLAGGGTCPDVTWGWKSYMDAFTRKTSSRQRAMTGFRATLVWPLCSKKDRYFSLMEGTSNLWRVLGVPMKEYSTQGVSPHRLCFPLMPQ